jgi:putative ABC transport system permease protein
MLENYIKMAWKVLLRRKLFAFISLFGISFTIFILMIAISYLDSMISPKGPEVKQNRILYTGNLMIRNSQSMRSSNSSYNFMKKYVSSLKTSELVSIFSEGMYYTYKNSRKFHFNYKCADQNFWQIFEFGFINGKPYGQREVENSERVAVISKSTAKNYFGTVNAVGMEIDIRSKMFKVIGIVDDVPLANEHTYADIWIPISFDPGYSLSGSYFGLCNAAILAYSENDLFKIKEEFHSHLISALSDMPGANEKSSIKCVLNTRLDLLAGEIIEDNTQFDNTPESTAFKTYTETGGISKPIKAISIIIGIMFVFMLLPAINLVNINLSRIMERSSEIGVRKAFGASRNALVKQFMVENLVLTLMGGVISFVLTIIAFSIINKSGLIVNTELTINFKVFVLSIAACLIFGFIAGVYPAYKMSKLHPVDSLRGGE